MEPAEMMDHVHPAAPGSSAMAQSETVADRACASAFTVGAPSLAGMPQPVAMSTPTQPDCPYCERSGEREMTDTSCGPDAATERVNCPWCKGTGDDLASKCCAGERGPFVEQKCVTCPYVASAGNASGSQPKQPATAEQMRAYVLADATPPTAQDAALLEVGEIACFAKDGTPVIRFYPCATTASSGSPVYARKK